MIQRDSVQRVPLAHGVEVGTPVALFARPWRCHRAPACLRSRNARGLGLRGGFVPDRPCFDRRADPRPTAAKRQQRQQEQGCARPAPQARSAGMKAHQRAAPGRSGTNRTGSSAVWTRPCALRSISTRCCWRVPTGSTRRPPWRKLLEQRVGHRRCGGCHQDGVEGGGILQPQRAVRVLQPHVVHVELPQLDARFHHQRGEALDRVHLARKPRQQGSLVAATSTDLEHLAQGLAGTRELEHARHHPRVGDGLAEADGKSDILIGAVCQRLIHENVPGHLGQRGQHRFVADALISQPLDHAQPRALRGHADAGMPVHGQPRPGAGPASRRLPPP